MSLNIGTEATAAARQLRASGDWRVIRDAMFEAARKAMNTAVDTRGDGVSDAVGYARALRDVYLAYDAATNNEPIQRVIKPGPK